MRTPYRRWSRAGALPLVSHLALHLALYLALPLALALASCTDGSALEPTRVLLRLRVDDEALRPDYLKVSWRAADGVELDDLRVPSAGVLARRGPQVASVEVQLQAASAGERHVFVRGMRGADELVSQALAVVPWRPGERVEVTLTLGPSASPPTGGDIDGGPPSPGAEAGAPAPDSGPPADAGAPADAGPGPAADAGPPIDAGADASGADRVPRDAPPARDLATDPRPEAPDASSDLPEPMPPVGTDLGTGLVLYLPFDDDSGRAPRDRSGNLHLVTLEGVEPSAAWTQGRFGGGLSLPGGSTPGRLEVASSDALNRLQSSFSLSAWVQPRQLPDGERSTLIARRATNTGFLYSLHLEGDRPAAWINSTHPAAGAATAGSGINEGSWVHLAVVYSPPRLRIFVNGLPVADEQYQLPCSPDFSPLLVGASQPGPDGARDPFAGRLDEVVVYERPLSVLEVAALAAGYRPPLR